MTRLAVSLIALSAFSGVAVAADLGGSSYGGSLKDDYVAPTTYRWDGVYVGGHIGWMKANPVGGLGCDSITRIQKTTGKLYGPDDPSVCDDENTKTRAVKNHEEMGELYSFKLGHRSKWVGITDLYSKESDSSFHGGAQLGILKQYGSFVFGLEGEWSWINDIKSKTGAGFAYFDNLKDKQLFDLLGTGDVHFKSELDWLATFRARLGMVMGSDGRLLGYVTGGAAVAKVSSSYGGIFENHTEGRGKDCPQCTFGPGGSDTFYQYGGAIGAGLEYALTDRFSIGAEYLYVALTGKQEKTVTFFDATNNKSFSITDKVGFDDIHTFKVKANFKFGG